QDDSITLYVHDIHSTKKSTLANNENDIISFYKPNELIVCPSYYEKNEITNLVSQIPDNVLFRILNPSGKGIIGSQNSKSKGELITVENTWNLNLDRYKRQKRFFDVIFGLMLLAFSWILVFFQAKKSRFFLHIFDTITGVKTWVGINDKHKNFAMFNKKSVILIDSEDSKPLHEIFVEEYINNYCRNYSIWMDLEICLRDIEKLSE
ncbi:MAG: hypothetical protein HOP11_15325, partial [Saprospiraceae bacterium]|nr:hypothetical protein [Saprospiraceae bacterium]